MQWPLSEHRQPTLQAVGGGWRTSGGALPVLNPRLSSWPVRQEGQPVRLTGGFLDHARRVVCVGRQSVPAGHITVQSLEHAGGEGKVKRA